MLNRKTLLGAFDRLGVAAIQNNESLEFLVYGGSALLIASNFRASTEDVDVHDVTTHRPQWLHAELQSIAETNKWDHDWLNDAVNIHLSPAASQKADHVPFGSFPRGPGPYGLNVLVPTAEYMLALKLKAMRVLDPIKGRQEASDILNLMKVTNITTPAMAIDILGKYFPKTAQSPEKQAFLLKRLSMLGKAHNAPTYPLSNSKKNSKRNSNRDGIE